MMFTGIEMEALGRIGADGMLLDQAEFCRRSGLSAKALSEAVAAGKVLRVDDAGGVPAYPAFHVDLTINQAELFAVLKRLTNFPAAAKWLFLVTTKGSLATSAGKPRTPLAALRAGEFDKVDRLALGFVEP